MKKTTTIIIVVILTISISLGFSTILEENISASKTNNTQIITFVIDAGHGGADSGAIGFSGNKEKDINLQIALKLYEFILFSGYNAVLIRNGDYEIYKDNETRNRSDLYNRLDLVNSINNSVLISIHQNHYDNAAEWGSQVWYSANTDLSKTIADEIQNSIINFIQPNNDRKNKVSDSSYYLLFKASVPSVMVECGFISNEEENIKLQDSKYQINMAFSIMAGINGVSYYGKQI